MPQLHFLGAAGTVTGSKYLLEANGQAILIDSGLYQGPRQLRERNHLPLPIDPRELAAVVLTHAHLDHSGYLPRLVLDGFKGPVYCTSATGDLLEILLPDSAHLLEEEARYKSKHRSAPKKPLYTIDDARRSLSALHRLPFHEPFNIAPGVQGYFRRAGHILGAATLELRVQEGEQETILVASGDLGRRGMLLVPDPEPVPYADVLLIESTYGDRRHDTRPATDSLAALIEEAVARRSVLLIPAFAVGRTQELLATIRLLERSGRIPSLPIFVDSPMAIEASELLGKHIDDLHPEARAQMLDGGSPIACGKLNLARSADESKALNELKGPAIIISASGMATGGRIMHHLRQRLPDPDSIICLSGFQAEGTLGRALFDGAEQVTIYGQSVPVRAQVRNLTALSAHADQTGLLAWCQHFRTPPLTFVIHGEAGPRHALATELRRQGWDAQVPQLGHKVILPHHLPLPSWPVKAPGSLAGAGSVRAMPSEARPKPAPVLPVAMPERLTIGVMGSATPETSDEVRAKAFALGRAIAAAGGTTLTGACPGLPHAAVLGAKAAGGLTIGISPAENRIEHVDRYASPIEGYDVLIYTGAGLHGREAVNVQSSDIVVIVGGRSGTLGELAHAYDVGKLIGVLTETGGLTDRIDAIVAACGKETGAKIILDADPENLIRRLLAAYPQHGLPEPDAETVPA